MNKLLNSYYKLIGVVKLEKTESESVAADC